MDGILPYRGYLDSLLKIYGAKSYWFAPSVFWLFESNSSLSIVSMSGLVCALIAFVSRGKLRTLALALAWLLYLSIVSIGQDFFAFQWDSLLLEAGLLAVILSSHYNSESSSLFWPQLLLRFLLFKLMFSSGVVKILSGDMTWRSFSALEYHYLSQPLPNQISYYLSHMPKWFHTCCTIGVLVTELVLPFLIFGNTVCRRFVALIFIMLQIAIQLSGNFAFFNMLTILLCLCLLDDNLFARLSPYYKSSCRKIQTDEKNSNSLVKNYDSLVILFLSFLPLCATLNIGNELPRFTQDISAWVSPLRSFNSYGLFAVMTTRRFELEIEGSMDGRNWTAYRFPYKVGEVDVAPPLVAPHQPRLDWQMWFAALSDIQQNNWLASLSKRLLEGSGTIKRMFPDNPFTIYPPKYIRILRYEYFFTKVFKKETESVWWRRKIVDLYLEPLTLENFAVPETD